MSTEVKTCGAKGCTKRAGPKGLCRKHYYEARMRAERVTAQLARALETLR